MCAVFVDLDDTHISKSNVLTEVDSNQLYYSRELITWISLYQSAKCLHLHLSNTLMYCHRKTGEPGRLPEDDSREGNHLYLAILQ